MKSALGKQLELATNSKILYSAIHTVRWHKKGGGWLDEITGLYYSLGKMVEFKKPKRHYRKQTTLKLEQEPRGYEPE